MQENELKFYERIGNWDFSDIKCKTEKITNWDFYDEILKNTDEKSLCLDLGTGGGEKVLTRYPDVGMIIATDFSKEMIKEAKKNQRKYPNKRVKFIEMNSLEMELPDRLFDLISARHTIINARQIYNSLRDGGVLVIEGIDKKDCIEIKNIFGRGQGYKDRISIAEKDYKDLQEAGFKDIEKIEIIEDEFYEREEDLLALLLKTPILDDFSEFGNDDFEHGATIEEEIFKKYVEQYKTEKGILLRRVLYGIVAKKM